MKLKDVTPGTWLTVGVIVGGIAWGGIKAYFTADEALRNNSAYLIELDEAIQENEDAIDALERSFGYPTGQIELRGGK